MNINKIKEYNNYYIISNKNLNGKSSGRLNTLYLF